MPDVDLTIDFDDIIDDLDDFFKTQIPHAANLALNESVFKSSVAVKKALPYFIEGGAVPFTRRGVQYKKSKNKRHLVASIFIPDQQWRYMQWVIDAGVKKFNRSKHGGSKPIYKNTRFNKYGNIPNRRRKEKIWRGLLDNGSKDQNGLGKNEFIGTIKGVTGLWKRLGKDGRAKLKLLVVFNHTPIYYGQTGKGRFPFKKFADKNMNKFFGPAFNRKLMQIIRREQSNLRIT